MIAVPSFLKRYNKRQRNATAKNMIPFKREADKVLSYQMPSSRIILRASEATNNEYQSFV